jgi:hypothetical protein
VAAEVIETTAPSAAAATARASSRRAMWRL